MVTEFGRQTKFGSDFTCTECGAGLQAASKTIKTTCIVNCCACHKPFLLEVSTVYKAKSMVGKVQPIQVQ
jgi:transcription elongation factor Elf1